MKRAAQAKEDEVRNGSNNTSSNSVSSRIHHVRTHERTPGQGLRLICWGWLGSVPASVDSCVNRELDQLSNSCRTCRQTADAYPLSLSFLSLSLTVLFSLSHTFMHADSYLCNTGAATSRHWQTDKHRHRLHANSCACVGASKGT